MTESPNRDTSNEREDEGCSNLECSTCSRESGAFHSGLNELGCEPSRSVKSTRSADVCSQSIGQASPSSTTCKPPSSPQPMSSAAGSPARMFLLPGDAPELPESVRDCTGNLCEPFAWYDRATRSWRTWQRCLVMGWTLFSGTWPRAGLTRNGIAYRRAPSAPLTNATASGLLPTPTASTGGPEPDGKTGRKLVTVLTRSPLPAMLPTLRANKWGLPDSHGSTAAWGQLIPTPRASDGDRGGRGDLLTVLRGYETKHAGTLPTPTARDWRSGLASQETHGKNSRPLNETVSAMAGNRSGRMNPRFREWMMSFPIGWTELRPPATRSSRSSRKSSAAQSSHPTEHDSEE